jgi:hypothetical protein
MSDTQFTEMKDSMRFVLGDGEWHSVQAIIRYAMTCYGCEWDDVYQALKELGPHDIRQRTRLGMKYRLRPVT